MRACAGWRPSDRQNSWRTNFEVRIKSDWKIVEADQNLEETWKHNQLRHRAKDRLGITRRGREHRLRVTRAQGSWKTFGMCAFSSLGRAEVACRSRRFRRPRRTACSGSRCLLRD